MWPTAYVSELWIDSLTVQRACLSWIGKMTKVHAAVAVCKFEQFPHWAETFF